jgi:WD repeat-containing protein 44
MEFSNDGRYLAAVGQNKKVLVWAVLSSMEEREADETEDKERGVDRFATKSDASLVRKKLIREYSGHTSSILDLSWSVNNFLLSSSMDKTARLWHVSREECLCLFNHHDFVTSIAFHPRDDRFFLAGSLDMKLRLWSIPDKRVAHCINVADMITAVAFSPDGKTCIAGCLSGLCLFYRIDGLRLYSQLHVRSSHGRKAKGTKITGIDTITIPPDDPNGTIKLLITSNDSRIRMYNFKDRNLEIKFRGHQNTSSQIRATFSDDGKYVICGSEDKRIYVWPTDSTEKREHDKRPVEIFESHASIVTSALFAPKAVRERLAQSGDPIYDLCSQPPSSLGGGRDNQFWARAGTDSNRSVAEQRVAPSWHSEDRGRMTEATPRYLVRHPHPSGNIIVSADYSGQIKIFRQDCAFKKRHQELSNGSSKLSRNRLLGMSGSATSRSSLLSARNSQVYSFSREPSQDRILSWRNSVTNGPLRSMESNKGSGATSGHDVSLGGSPLVSSIEGVTNRRILQAGQTSATSTSSLPSNGGSLHAAAPMGGLILPTTES